MSLDEIAWSEADLAIPDLRAEPRREEPGREVRSGRRAEDARSAAARRPGDLTDGAEQAVAAAAPGAVSCVAFQGVGGGAGVTSLAVGVSQALAERGGGVCLVDLDFELGACASYLDVEPGARLEDFRVEPGRVDATFARALLVEHPGGVHVLAVEPEAGEANPHTVLAVLDALSDLFGTLVLDVPRRGGPWTEAVLRAADRTVLVSELHIPALHRARGRLEALGAKADVVLNKYERRSFKASLRRADAGKALGRDVLGVVAVDPHTSAECINCGEPVGRLSPDGRLGRDVAALAEALVPAKAKRGARGSARGAARGR